jgi:glutathione transport system ATP-binding protein
MIALAIAAEPALLIADEPTTALDVTVQAELLELLREMQRSLRLAVLLITHDFGVIAEMADRVVVLHRGRVVEEAAVQQIFDAPASPHTRALLACLPGRDPSS